MKKRLLAILSLVACMSIGFTSPLNSMSAMATEEDVDVTSEAGDSSDDADEEVSDDSAEDDSSDTGSEVDEQEQLVNSYSGLIDEFADAWFTGEFKKVDTYLLKSEIMYSMYGGSLTFEYGDAEDAYQKLVSEAGAYVGDGDATGKLSDDKTCATVSKVIKCEKKEMLFTVSHNMNDGSVVFTVSAADAAGDTDSAESAESGDFAKAGLNTFLGMGTVFIVLIFISFIISLFVLFEKIGKKPAGQEETKAEPVAAPVAETADNDDEIAVVIAAAIAAYEADADVYDVPADGLYVRSIKKRGFC